MKIIIYILAIFLLPAISPGQQNIIIKGQVTDADSNDPLPESHVYISCRHMGTITDEGGNFLLEIPRCCMTQCLIISYMGYQKYIIPVHDISKKKLNIHLEQGVIALAEIIISPDYYRIIYQPKYEPYRPGNIDVLIENDGYIQAISLKKFAKLSSMY